MADDAILEQDASKEDIIKLLAEDDVDDDVDLEKPKSEEKDEKEEDEEPEEKEEIELNEDIEEVDFQNVPRKKEILAKFPEIFKTFPGIERAIYRDQQYAEVFPTVAEAKEAAESVAQFKQLEGSLLAGDLATVLTAVKNSDSDAFAKIGDNLLQTIAAVDKDTYQSIIGNVLQHAIYNMAHAGVEAGNEDLKTAALLFNQFVFGKTKIEQPTVKQRVETSDKEKEFATRQENFVKQQYNVAVNDVGTRAQNIIKSNVERVIDPKGVMSSYVKNNAIKDVMSQVESSIASDARFQSTLQVLWKQSFEGNHSEANKLKIRNAILSKTKTVLSEIVRKVRADALKGVAARKKDDEDEEDKKPLPRGNVRNETKREKEPEKKKMRTIDFLNQD